MITNLGAASFDWRCMVGGEIFTTNYSAVTIGISAEAAGAEAGIRSIGLTCPTHGVQTYYLTDSRASLSGLMLHTLWDKALAAGCTIHADYLLADVQALIAGKEGIDDYVTLPFAPADKNGYMHYEAARKELSAAQVLDRLRTGARIYGTEAVIRAAINECITDSATRKVVLKNHDLA